jgi:hypothetical protein
LQALDEMKGEIENAVASGFLLDNPAGQTYLYTSWHVATGFDPREPEWMPLPRPPTRCYLRVEMQDAEQRNEFTTVTGGLQTLEIPLFDEAGAATWEQDEVHRPHADLNAIGFVVPFWTDMVRLPLPSKGRTSHQQTLLDPIDIALGTLLLPGEKLYVIGFPFGYSAHGTEQPTPIVLIRNVAAARTPGLAFDFLLDGAGAQGMSGGPIFIEREGTLKLAAIYSGARFPRRAKGPTRERDFATALGLASHLSLGMHSTFVKPMHTRPMTEA